MHDGVFEVDKDGLRAPTCSPVKKSPAADGDI
jgi:hypothetical protein